MMGQEVHPYLLINLKRINLYHMAHRQLPHKGSICEAPRRIVCLELRLSGSAMR